MRIVKLYVDSEIVAIWGCEQPDAPALFLDGSITEKIQTEEAGCELAEADRPQAGKVLQAWGLPDEPPPAGTYWPKDGMSFLAALYGTYARGSRMWAIATIDTATAQEGERP